MALEFDDIKHAVSSLQPSQAMEVARIAQLAVEDMSKEGKLWDTKTATPAVEAAMQWQGSQTSDPWAGTLIPFGTSAINEWICGGTTNPTIAIDPTVTFGGRPTSRVAFGGIANETNFQLGTATASVPIEGVARELLSGYVAVAVKGTVPATGVRVYVSDNSFANYYEVAIFADNNSVVVDIGNGWRLMMADTSLPGVLTTQGNPNLDGLKRVKIRCFSDSAPAAGAIWVGFAGVIRKPKATVVLTADDGYLEWYNYLFPAMEARNIPGSFCVDAGYVGQPGFMTEQQYMLTVQQKSRLIELVNHGANNLAYSPGVNLSAYTANILQCDTLLRKWGVPEKSRKLHTYVQGQYDQALINWLVANGFNSAREVGASNRSQFTLAALLSTANTTRSSRYAIPAGCNLSDAQPVATVIGYIEEAKRRGSAFFIMGHEFKSSPGPQAYVAGYHPTHGMSNLLDYLKEQRDAGNINLVTWSDYIATLGEGNSVQKYAEPTRQIGGMEYFRDRIRQGAPKVRPFMTQKHIVDYPAWSSGMAVQAGTTVKVAISGLNQLFAWLGDGGTSTTQPSVMSTWKPQADAGVAGSGSDIRGWIYIGPERRDTRMAAEIASYTYTTTTPAGLTSYGAWNASSPLRQLGVIENLSNDCWPKVQAGDSIEVRSGWRRKDGTQVSGTGSIAFYTDTDLIAWSMFNDATRQDFNFEVDDVPYSFTPRDRGTNGIRVLQFTNRRRRLIRIHNVGGIMQNIYMRAGEQIEPVTDLLAQRMLWVGDSYHGGAAPGPLVFPGFIPSHVSRNLGLPYMHNPSIGGKGFEYEGSSPLIDNSLTQMLELDVVKHAESQYMAVWLCMSGNDTGRPAAGVLDSYIRALRVCRAGTRFVDSPIFVCTRFNGAGSTEANDMNALMAQAISTVADPYIFVIPMGTDRSTGGALLNAMNINFYIGTSDQHPFDGGHRLFADYVSDQVLRIMGINA